MSISALSRCVLLRTRWSLPLKGSLGPFKVYGAAYSSQSEGLLGLTSSLESYNAKYDEAAVANDIDAFSEQLRLNALTPKGPLSDNIVRGVRQLLSSPVQHSIPAIQWISNLTKLGLRYRQADHNELLLGLVKLHLLSNTSVPLSSSFTFVTALYVTSYDFGDNIFSKVTEKSSSSVSKSSVSQAAVSEYDKGFSTMVAVQTSKAIEYCSQKSDIGSLLSVLVKIKLKWSHLPAESQSLLMQKIVSFYSSVDLESDVGLIKALKTFHFPLGAIELAPKISTIVTVLEKLLAMEKSVEDYEKLLSVLSSLGSKEAVVSPNLRSVVDKAIRTMSPCSFTELSHRAKYFNVLRRLDVDEFNRLRRARLDFEENQEDVAVKADKIGSVSVAVPSSSSIADADKVTVVRTVTSVETVQTFKNGVQISSITAPTSVTKTVTESQEGQESVSFSNSVATSVLTQSPAGTSETVSKAHDSMLTAKSEDPTEVRPLPKTKIRPTVVRAWSALSAGQREEVQNNLLNYKGTVGSPFLPGNFHTTLDTLSKQRVTVSQLKPRLQKKLEWALLRPDLFVYDAVTKEDVISVFNSMELLKFDFSRIENGCFDDTLRGMTALLSGDEFVKMCCTFGALSRKWCNIPLDIIETLLEKFNEPLQQNTRLAATTQIPLMAFDIDSQLSSVDTPRHKELLFKIYRHIAKGVALDFSTEQKHPVAAGVAFIRFLETFAEGREILKEFQLSVPQGYTSRVKGKEKIAEVTRELDEQLRRESETSCGGRLRWDFSEPLGPEGAIELNYPLYLDGALIAFLVPVNQHALTRSVEFRNYMVQCYHNKGVACHALPRVEAGEKTEVTERVAQMMTDIRLDLFLRFGIVSSDPSFAKRVDEINAIQAKMAAQRT